MNILEAVRIAWSSLMANKLRALLTMLGIIIGVGAVVGMLAIGNGYAQYVNNEFTKLGIGVFYITPGGESTSTERLPPPRLTADDAAALRQPGAVPGVQEVAIEYEGGSQVVSAGGERYAYPVKAVTPNHFTISDNELGYGRFLDSQDERVAGRVALIGSEVAETLFGDGGAAVGRRITINGTAFDVVGVLTTEANQASGATGSFSDPTEEIYVPYTTGVNRLFRNQVDRRVNVGRLTVRVADPDQVDAAIEAATRLLRERHRLAGYQENDFSTNNPEEAAQQFSQITTGLGAFLGVIAGISLLVGGIGIMNIMLVSVSQRTREIGLRKAVGARQRDILLQFLIEAVVLCLVGCAIGIALGMALSLVGTLLLVAGLQLEGAQATVSASSIILATAVSAGIGIGFGFFPALRAARLDPIQALRSE